MAYLMSIQLKFTFHFFNFIYFNYIWNFNKLKRFYFLTVFYKLPDLNVVDNRSHLHLKCGSRRVLCTYASVGKSLIAKFEIFVEAVALILLMCRQRLALQANVVSVASAPKA